MHPDDAVAVHALARGFLDAVRLEEARRRLVELRQAGRPGDLLGALAPALAPAQLAELRAVAAAAARQGAPARPAATGAATVVGKQADLAAPAPAGAPLLPERPGSWRVAPPLLQPGEQVGPYVTLRELGRGGMGVVFEARHAQLGRLVALKVRLPGGHKGDRRFLIEAEAAARLTHDHIVRVHDAGEADGRLWLAMDLVAGESLERRLERDGPLEPGEAARVAATVARALHHAHERGVLHRDIKPANILLRDGEPLLVDFGLARVVEGAESLTKTGELLGTPAYMPPEQANGRGADARSDVWSLGATLYHMLCGKAPFEGESLVAVLARVLVANYPPLSSVRPDVPPALTAVVRRCLARRAEDRYPSAAALAEDLERFDHEATSGALDEERARRRRVAAVALALGLTVVGLVAAIARLSRAEPPPPAVAPAPPVPRAPSPEERWAAVTAPGLAPDARAVALRDLLRAYPDHAPAWALWERTRSWQRVTPTGPGPPARDGATALTWDAARRALLLFGGWNDRQVTFDDLWAWDGTGWVSLEAGATRPPGRHGFGLALDERRGRLVVHGGLGQDGKRREDTWEWTGERWESQPLLGGPEARSWHAMTWDEDRGVMALFGGCTTAGRGVKLQSDLWEWSGGEAWTARDLSERPTALQAPCLVSLRRRLLVFGGYAEGVARADLWTCDARGWRPGEVTGDRPPPRLAAGMVADARGRAVLFGGVAGETWLDDTWVLEADGGAWRWSRVDAAERPPPRGWHAMGYDRARRCVVVFGGSQPGNRPRLDDLWELPDDP